MPPKVIIKADDYALNSGAQYTSWTRFLDDIVTRGLRAWAGAIGDRCVAPSSAIIAQVQAWESNGIEFGGHGWTHSPVYEFKGRSIGVQKAHIRETQRLLEDVYEIPCRAFAAPYNEVEVNTGHAVKAAGVDVWLFPKWGQGLDPVTPNVAITNYLSRSTTEIETATGVPSLSKLQQTFEATRPYVCIQVHPNSFAGESQWTEWNACLDWLVTQGCEFKTPCEYFNL